MKKRRWICVAAILGLAVVLATCGLVLPTFALLRHGLAWSGKCYLSSPERDTFITDVCYIDEGGALACRRVESRADEGAFARKTMHEIGDLYISFLKQGRRFQATDYVVDRAGVPFRAVRVALNENTDQGYIGNDPPMCDFPRAFVLGVDWARLVCQYLLFAILFAVGPVVIRYGRSKWRKLRPLVADDQEEEALG